MPVHKRVAVDIAGYTNVGEDVYVEDHAPSAGLWILYMVFWSGLTVVSLALIIVTKQLLWGAILFSVVTVVGIAWRPLFGLCLVFGILPIGELGLHGIFSLDRGVAILFFLGFVANSLIHPRGLRFRHPVIWTLLVLMVFSLLSVSWSEYPGLAGIYTFALFQLLVMSVLMLTVLSHGRVEQNLWPLRAFVIGGLLAFALGSMLGISYTHVGVQAGEAERFTFSLIGEERGLDNYAVACTYGLAFFMSVYLLRIESRRILRWLWLIPMAVAAIVILMTGSRGGTFALVMTIAIPLLFIRQVLKRPIAAIGVVLLLVVLALIVLIGAEYIVAAGNIARITDIEYLKDSAAVRFSFITESLAYVSAHPLGAGQGNFRSSGGSAVHNDFFYCLSNLGYLGAVVFGGFVIAMIVLIKRMSDGVDKWFARSILLFLLITGLSLGQIFQKHYWFSMLIIGYIAYIYRRSAAAQHSYSLPEYEDETRR